MNPSWLLTAITLICGLSSAHGDEVSAPLVGWSNVLIPGLGATLRGQPGRGLIEAAIELGMYFGGSAGTAQGPFTIDGSVQIPTDASLYRPLAAQILQEAGLKAHFYDTFYNYQQAALSQAESDREKTNPQPLYTGSVGDQLLAPFQWRNLSSPWVYPIILASGAYLVTSYATSTVSPQPYQASGGENALYAFSQIGVIPFGSAFGEESFFRGFIQREMRATTGSAVAALLIQSALFTILHPDPLKISAFASGIYFGIQVNHFDGNLEQAIATHFWVNVIDGVTTYFQFRRSQGLDAPFNPPVGLRLSFALN